MRINNKFKVGETVFFLLDNRVANGKIAMIKTWTTYKGTSVEYCMGNGYMAGSGLDMYEHQLFKTKEDLLKTL